MQKRSHKLLASTLLRSCHGFPAKRFELAFLFGSFEPDCNPLTYLKGSLRGKKLGGHNYSNSQRYINDRIRHLQSRSRWTMWNYYTLGKLTHYLADAFTYPHNDNFPDTLLDHHRYETALRLSLAKYLKQRHLPSQKPHQDLPTALSDLHRQYLVADDGGMGRDIRYILRATGLLMAGCLPASRGR